MTSFQNYSPRLSLPVWMECGVIAAVLLIAGFFRTRNLGEWPVSQEEAHLLLRQLRGGFGSSFLEQLQSLLPNRTPVAALRFPGFAAAMILLPMAFLWLRAIAGNALALATVILLAFSPLHLHLASLGNIKSLLFFAATAASILCFHRPGILRLASFLGLLLCFGAELMVFPGDAVDLVSGAGPWAFFLDTVGLAVPMLFCFGLVGAFRRQQRALTGLGLLAVAAMTAGSLLRRDMAVTPVAACYLVAGYGLAEMLSTLDRKYLLMAATCALCLIPPLPAILSQQSDNSRFAIGELIDELESQRLADDPVYSTVPEIVEYYSGIPCFDLPESGAEVAAILAQEPRAFFVVTYHQSRLTAPHSAAVQNTIQANTQLQQRVASNRFDRHRYEARLYQWSGPAP